MAPLGPVSRGRCEAQRRGPSIARSVRVLGGEDKLPEKLGPCHRCADQRRPLRSDAQVSEMVVSAKTRLPAATSTA